jgi:hypothetical protein
MGDCKAVQYRDDIRCNNLENCRVVFPVSQYACPIFFPLQHTVIAAAENVKATEYEIL